MQTPVQISFHDLSPSAALEAAVRAEIPRLEKAFDRIVSCRVGIEGPHHHHHKGQVYRVSIELGVPGKVLVVGRAPSDHTEHGDPFLALRDAFHAARRQLHDYVEQSVRGDVKSHAAA